MGTCFFFSDLFILLGRFCDRVLDLFALHDVALAYRLKPLKYAAMLMSIPPSCEPRPESTIHHTSGAVEAALSPGSAIVPPSFNISLMKLEITLSKARLLRAVVAPDEELLEHLRVLMQKKVEYVWDRISGPGRRGS